MSKKNKYQHLAKESVSGESRYVSHEAEYRVIKSDLSRVFVMNVLYLGILLAIYFTNNQSHYLERWFEKVLHI